MSHGYSEMAYLDEEITIGEDRDDGYTPILSGSQEVVHVPSSKLPELFTQLAYAMGIEEAESILRGLQ